MCFCVRACVRVHVLAGGGVGGSDLVEAEALDEGRHLGQALGPAALVPRGMRRIEQQREDLTRRVHLRGRDPSERKGENKSRSAKVLLVGYTCVAFLSRSRISFRTPSLLLPTSSISTGKHTDASGSLRR